MGLFWNGDEVFAIPPARRASALRATLDRWRPAR
jgi:hypothetical protein